MKYWINIRITWSLRARLCRICTISPIMFDWCSRRFCRRNITSLCATVTALIWEFKWARVEFVCATAVARTVFDVTETPDELAEDWAASSCFLGLHLTFFNVLGWWAWNSGCRKISEYCPGCDVSAALTFLNPYLFSCLTKLEKFVCRTIRGRTCVENSWTSFTSKASQASVQEKRLWNSSSSNILSLNERYLLE